MVDLKKLSAKASGRISGASSTSSSAGGTQSGYSKLSSISSRSTGTISGASSKVSTPTTKSSSSSSSRSSGGSSKSSSSSSSSSSRARAEAEARAKAEAEKQKQIEEAKRKAELERQKAEAEAKAKAEALAKAKQAQQNIRTNILLQEQYKRNQEILARAEQRKVLAEQGIVDRKRQDQILNQEQNIQARKEYAKQATKSFSEIDKKQKNQVDFYNDVVKSFTNKVANDVSKGQIKSPAEYMKAYPSLDANGIYNYIVTTKSNLGQIDLNKELQAFTGTYSFTPQQIKDLKNSFKKEIAKETVKVSGTIEAPKKLSKQNLRERFSDYINKVLTGKKAGVINGQILTQKTNLQEFGKDVVDITKLVGGIADKGLKTIQPYKQARNFFDYILPPPKKTQAELEKEAKTESFKKKLENVKFSSDILQNWKNNAKGVSNIASKVKQGISLYGASIGQDFQAGGYKGLRAYINLLDLVYIGSLVDKPFKAKKIKTTTDLLDTTREEIKKLEKTTNIRDRGLAGQQLRELYTQEKILTKYKFNTAPVLKEFETSIKPLVTKFDKAKGTEKIKVQTQIINKINNTEKKIISASKKAKEFRKQAKKGLTELKPETISKKLGEFFKVEKGELKLKVTKMLPSSETELNVLFKQASKQGGEAFSKLKTKLKKEQGLNVVKRTNKKGETFYKFLEPKEQRKLGKLTGKKAKEKVIQITPREKTKILAQENKAVKSLKDLEFEKGQNLDKVQKDFVRIAREQEKSGLFSNKKAQARLDFQTKKFYNNVRKEVKSTIDKVRKKGTEIRNKYLSEKKRYNELKLKRNKIKSDFEKLKTSRQRLTKLAEEVKVSKTNLKKVLSALRVANSILRASANIQGQPQAKALALTPAIAQAVKQLQDQDQALKQITELINQTPSPTKGTSDSIKTTTPTTKTTTIKKIVPKTPIKPSLKINKLKTKKPTPPEKPKLPLPKLKFDSKKLDNKVLTAVATFRERRDRNKPAGRNNPIITKQIKLRDTKNKIIKAVRDRVDKSLARSLTVKIVGVGKTKKDIAKPSLAKFRPKLSKNTPVLKLVEKSKYTFDTPQEKKELKTQKFRKKQNGTKNKSKPIKKKVFKPSSPKTKQKTIRRNTNPNKNAVRRVKTTSNVKRVKPSRSTKKSNKTTKRGK